MFEKIKKSNKISCIYNDCKIKNSVSLKDQLSHLKEDLLQISYKNGYIIDLGWYPEFDINGMFKIYIIQNHQWDNPIKEIKCNDIALIEKHIYDCMSFVEERYDA